MKRASFYVLATACLALAAAGAVSQANSQPASPSLDYEYFKTKVQPIFLTHRDGHTRCAYCHMANNAPFHLVKLSPQATTWTEAQSRQNFQLIQKVAIPGVMDSPIIHHPLAGHAGGDPHHGGGDQFESQDDPAWKTLKAFVMGAKA